MADTSLVAALRHIRALTDGPSAANATDGQLLERFASRREEAAFAVLLRRHGPMVLGVCWRVLGRVQDAEDAFQATFLLLARKASSIRKQGSVGSWLHGVAHRLAVKAKAQDDCRRAHERRAGSMRKTETGAPAAWMDLQEALDEALQALPDHYRAALVICHLEGRTHEEAARQLGCPITTLRSRLTRGRKLLRRELTRRGLVLSAGAVGMALLANVAEAAPAALVVATVKTASQFAAGRAAAGLISIRVASLTKGMLKAMFVNKLLKTGAVVLLLLGTAALTGVMLAGGPKPPTQPVPADPPVAPAPPAAPVAAGTMRVVALDPQGKPLPGANIHSGIWTEEKGFKSNHDYKTDAAGAAQVELPKTFTILRLWASAKPFVTLFAGWEQNELASGKGVPTDYTFRMEPGVAAGGRIVDEEGEPIAGAKVQVMLGNDQTLLANDPKAAGGDGRMSYDPWLATGNDAATTDAEGRWHIDNVPNSPQAKLSLLISHGDYVSDENWRRQGAETLTLKRGVVVRGRVTDPAGEPIKDALVVVGDDPYKSSKPSEFPTDADGRFRLPALAEGKATLTVVAHGWAPQLRKINVRAGLPPQDFHMEAGKTMRLRIVDAAGKPVPGASVGLTGWKGGQSLLSTFNPNHPKVPDPKIPCQADADGLWEWTWAPDDAVKLSVWSNGFAESALELAGGASERTVTLRADHIVGRVTDAATGKPVPAFTVIPIDVFRKDFLGADRGNAGAGKDGRLSFAATRTDIPLRLRVEAEGYRTQDGPEFRVGDDTARTQDFRLQPSRPVAGMVLDAEGRPVANAEVLLATPTEQITLNSSWDNHKTTTDAMGRFAFPDPGESWAVLARSDAGFVRAEGPADQHDAGTLRLQPWASVRGQFRDGGKLVRGATILLRPIRLDALDRPRIENLMQTVTDADGRFEFPRVPPGSVCVWVSLGPWKDASYRSGPNVPLDLKPGGRAELDLGGAGAVVTGKVALTGKVPADLDCTYSINYLVPRERGITPPPAIADLGFDARNGWRETWQNTTEGLTYLSTLRHWFVKLAPDGAFRISGVPVGEYDLAVEVYAKPSGCLVDPLARTVVRVTVTASDAARGELALPEIAAAVVPIPAVGDTPALAFHRADGTAGSLADCRGKYTVVHFWASWCGPCKQQLPALRRLQERFAAHGLATLSLSLDDDDKAWQAALKRLGLPWPQGRLDSAAAAGVSSVPAYWLLDPAGKIVSKVYDPDELAAPLADRLK